MPIYAYRCPSCQGEFEVSRKFSESGAPAECPTDGTASQRIFSPPMLNIPSRTGGGGSFSAVDVANTGSSWSHQSHEAGGHGHSHGPGGGHGHSHAPGSAPHSH